ncbi:hypothetical protein TNCV_1995671 [Trichonephila clavipes]|nr:hypothetical protein TNCV_1995671 [Trichonephila clavipes]
MSRCVFVFITNEKWVDGEGHTGLARQSNDDRWFDCKTDIVPVHTIIQCVIKNSNAKLNVIKYKLERINYRDEKRSKVLKLSKKNEIRESSFEKKVEGRGRHPSSNPSRERLVGFGYKSHILKARVEEVQKKCSFRSTVPRGRCRSAGKSVFNSFPGPTAREPRVPSKNAFQIRKELVEPVWKMYSLSSESCGKAPPREGPKKT